MSRSARLVRLVLVLGSLVIAIAWTQVSSRSRNLRPAAHPGEGRRRVQDRAGPTHNAAARRFGYSFFAKAPGLKLVFRKRASAITSRRKTRFTTCGAARA